MEPLISEFLTKFSTCLNPDSAIDFMVKYQSGHPELRYIMQSGAYIYKNYYFLPTYVSPDNEFLVNLEKYLKFINKIGACKTSAPRFIGKASTLDKVFTVLIQEIPETNNAELIPYTQTSGATTEKKEQFKNELLDLMQKTKIINPALFIDIRNLYLTPDTKNIVFANWGALKQYDSEQEKKDYIETLSKFL